MDQVAWLKRFLHERGPDVPDGRPLYAYRCTEKEYDQALALSGEMLRGILRGIDYRRFAEIFCLFASETWQRRYGGGAWSYDTIFAALGAPVPDHNRIRDWIARGLNWWKRPLIVSEGGTTQYLLTIGCEGGLPLRLLGDAEARLSPYFRELLTAMDREPGVSVEVLARREMLLLPISLRRDVVFAVSAQLVEAISRLQPLTEGAEDPIGALDAAEPGWRRQLPLPLDNEAVEVLLGKLVRHAQSLRDHSRQAIRWVRGLEATGEHHSLFAALRLPDHIDATEVSRWTSRGVRSPRLRLLLSSGGETRTAALLSLVRRRDGTDAYRCEATSRGGVRLHGHAAMATARLSLTDGAHEAVIEVHGEQGLGQLPWVFRDTGNTGEAEYLGEGSVRSRRASLIVAVNADDRVDVRSPDAAIECIGEIARVGRRLYRVTGEAAVTSPSGDTCGVRCASDSESADTYILLGRQLEWVAEGQPVYVGIPRVEKVNAQGGRLTVPLEDVHWSPVGMPGVGWQRGVRGCAGRVWLRCVDGETGDTLARRQIDVVPGGARVSVRIASDDAPGAIELLGLEGGEVQCLETHAASTRSTEDGATVELLDGGRDVRLLTLRLWWPERTPFEIRVPAPRRGGAFLNGGVAVARGQLVALERLGGVEAVAFTPTTGSGFVIDATVRSDRLLDPELQRLLWLQLPLTNQGDGEYRVHLHQVQEPLGALMAMAADPGVHAVVALKDATGLELARINVARYDLLFEPERSMGHVILPAEAVARLGVDWEDRVSVEMFPLWDLDQSRRLLSRDEGAEGVAWTVPADLEPGPWWIVGRDGGWARFRPLLWTVATPEEERGGNRLSPLSLAVRESDPERRESMMDNVVMELAQEVESADWERLLGYLRLTREHPAHTLQVFSSLARCPQALALLLFKAGLVEDAFDRAWSLTDEMPFTWYLLPAFCWMQAARRHFAQLRKDLSPVRGGEQIVVQTFESFRQRSTDRLSCFSIICDLLQEDIFPEVPPSDRTLAHFRSDPDRMRQITRIQLNDMRQSLQARLDAEIHWPEGPRVMEEVWRLPAEVRFEADGFRRSVLCAPFVAADIFLHGGDVSLAVILELRRLRAFDTSWFDGAFTVQISLGLAAGNDGYR